MHTDPVASISFDTATGRNEATTRDLRVELEGWWFYDEWHRGGSAFRDEHPPPF
jgi:hypothetical protein